MNREPEIQFDSSLSNPRERTVVVNEIRLLIFPFEFRLCVLKISHAILPLDRIYALV